MHALSSPAEGRPQQGLHFAASVRLRDAAHSGESLVKILEADDRLEPVTVHHLREANISQFGWVRRASRLKPPSRGATARSPGFLGLARHALGCAAHSGRAANRSGAEAVARP